MDENFNDVSNRKIKFKMSIKELSFEFEGDQQVGQSLQAGIQRTLGSLVDTHSRIVSASSAPTLAPAASEAALPTSGRRGSSVGRRTKGNGVKALVLKLISTGAFSEKKGLAEVKALLEKKGHDFKANAIANVLKALTQKEFLLREDGESGYAYVKGPNEDYGNA